MIATMDTARPEASRLAAAEAARELALAAHRITRRIPPGVADGLAGALRREATAVALLLERADDRPVHLPASLRSLWRTSDLVDLAERRGWLDLQEAMELLTLGSRVEIPLVLCLNQGPGPATSVSRGQPIAEP